MSPLLKIKVKPRSVRSGMKWENGEWIARVGAIPENGKANRELIRMLADFFNTAKSGVRIKSGERSSIKWVHIPDSIDEKKFRGGTDG